MLEDMLGGASNRVVDEYLFRERLCVRCNFNYREAENMGTRLCRGFHPMEGFRVVHDGAYRCCEQRIGTKGCVAADHTDFTEWSDSHLPVVESIAEAVLRYQKASNGSVRPATNAWLFDRATKRWWLQRIDGEAYRERLE